MLLRRRPPRQQFSWRTLAFEVLVVVLGVTLALGANEVRQWFADRHQERIALESIAGEMEYNCEQLTRTLAYHEQVLDEIDSLRAARPDAVDDLNFTEEIPSWYGYNPAFVTSSAYETAQAKGALALFPYDQALGIGRYYTFVALYQNTVREALGMVVQTGTPSFAQAESAFQISAELERELGPISCEGARAFAAEFGASPEES